MTFMLTRRRIATLLVALVTFLALLAPTPAQAHSDFKVKRQLTLMTQNLYLGADLTPAITAQTLEEFVAAANQIFAEFLATDYPTRSGAIADEIFEAAPDLIGLQEVALWTLIDPAGNTTIDFLEILQQQLAARGLSYSVGAVSENANIGPIPLSTTSAVVFQDRDVILVNDKTEGLTITDAASGNYEAQQFFQPPVGDPISFDRGWALVDGKFRDRRFRFVNTHLETEDFPDVQEKQAREFLAGPARKRGTVFAVGDFNSAADGSTTETYRMLTRWPFRDAWRANRHSKGFTCCQNSGLSNEVSELSSRIDLVLIKGWVWARSAQVVGDEPFQKTAPVWPSDHAFVKAVIRLF